MKSGQQMMAESRVHCMRIAEGEFSPVVIQPYGPLIGGETGFCIGYVSQTETGRSCIVWLHKPTKKQ